MRLVEFPDATHFCTSSTLMLPLHWVAQHSDVVNLNLTDVAVLHVLRFPVGTHPENVAGVKSHERADAADVMADAAPRIVRILPLTILETLGKSCVNPLGTVWVPDGGFYILGQLTVITD